jgi:hypothetical protein
MFLIKSPSKLLDIYRDFAKMVKTQFPKHFKAFRFENAIEYTPNAFQNILKLYGTIPHLSCLDTS